MKHSIGVAPRFPGFILAIVLAVLVFSVVYNLTSGSTFISDQGLVPFVFMILYPAFVASTLLGIAFVLLRIALSPIRPIPALLILWAESLVMIFLVLPLVGGLTDWDGPSATLELGTPSVPLDTVLRSGDVALVVRGETGLQLDDVVVVDFAAEPRISRYRRGYLDPREHSLVVENGPELYLGDAFFPAQESAELPQVIQRTVEDVNLFSQRMREHGRFWQGTTIPAALELLAVSVFFLSLWTLARMSQWLLLNWALVLLASRFFFFVYHPAVKGFVEMELPPSLVDYGPAIEMAIAATLLIVVGILLPPVKRWRTDVAHEK